MHMLITISLALFFRNVIGMKNEPVYKAKYYKKEGVPKGVGVWKTPPGSRSSSSSSSSSEEPEENPIPISQFEPEIIDYSNQPEEIDWTHIPKALYENPSAIKKFRAQQAARQKIMSTQQPIKKTGLSALLPTWLYNWWYGKQ